MGARIILRYWRKFKELRDEMIAIAEENSYSSFDSNKISSSSSSSSSRHNDSSQS